ncbi:MAG: ankyrin repeat domain-containing protein, partial [Desulfitobacteriaceae bacterium]
AEVKTNPINGNTALINSVLKGNSNNTDILLQYGANVNSKIADRESILAYAVRNNLTPIVQTLIKYNVSVSQDDLIKASDKAEIAELFVSKGYVNNEVASNVKQLYQKYLPSNTSATAKTPIYNATPDSSEIQNSATPPTTAKTPIYKITPASSEIQNANTSKELAVQTKSQIDTQALDILTAPKIFNIKH